MDQNYDFYQQPETPTPSAEATKKKPGNGYAIASLVLGIIALIFATICCCFLYIAPILAILSIVFAIVARKKAGKFTGMMIAGLILAIIALLIFLLLIAAVNMIIAPLNDMTTQEALEYLAELTGMNEEELREMIESTYGMSYEEFWEQLATSPVEE